MGLVLDQATQVDFSRTEVDSNKAGVIIHRGANEKTTGSSTNLLMNPVKQAMGSSKMWILIIIITIPSLALEEGIITKRRTCLQDSKRQNIMHIRVQEGEGVAEGEVMAVGADPGPPRKGTGV